MDKHTIGYIILAILYPIVFWLLPFWFRDGDIHDTLITTASLHIGCTLAVLFVTALWCFN